MTTDVFIERQLPEPLTAEGVRMIADQFDSCLGIHRIGWHGSLLSTSGDEMFCHFTAPDAESVRIATREMGAPPGQVWSCRVHDTAGTGPAELERTAAIILHRFDEPAAFGARALEVVVDMGCFQLHRVRLLRSYLSNDGLRMVSLYEAPDAESVRIAQQRAGLPADRVVAVRRFAP